MTRKEHEELIRRLKYVQRDIQTRRDAELSSIHQRYEQTLIDLDHLIEDTTKSFKKITG